MVGMAIGSKDIDSSMPTFGPISSKKNFNFHIHFNCSRCRFKDLCKIISKFLLPTRFYFMNPKDRLNLFQKNV